MHKIILKNIINQSLAIFNKNSILFPNFEFAFYKSRKLNKENWENFNIEVFSQLHKGQMSSVNIFLDLF